MNRLFIIIDMQNDFVTGSLNNEEAKKIVPNMVNFLNNLDSNSKLIFTRDTHYDNYLDTNEGKHLPVKHCINNTYGHEIIDELKKYSNNSLIIDKPSFGLTTNIWNDYLKNYQFDEIYLTGVCTDICVISNALALKALYKELPIYVISDLCAGVTIKTHNEALDVMKMCQVDIITLKDYNEKI